MKVRLRMGMPRGQDKAWPTSIIYTVPGMPQESVGRGYVFTPGRYAGAEEVEANATPFPERFAALQATLGAQFAESERLTQVIHDQLANVVVAGD